MKNVILKNCSIIIWKSFEHIMKKIWIQRKNKDRLLWWWRINVNDQRISYDKFD